ncbi:unannotated protein [freshwater metagenome]|uniref:Unannotated protein n=1 Tax=freshwater metagenome TaxID=449393 RepID=A0A6J6HVF6_9ZZZZ|nr:hypothetical protein [Actinomycetota bacterium]
MHPIEHLRYVARAHGADPLEVALGAADALSGIAHDPAGALVAARRLVEHHPTNAPLWSVCAHAVTSMEPYRDVDDLARKIANDPTATQLVDALDGANTICMVGWSGHLVDALARRGDIHALVIDSSGDGQDALRYLSRHDVSCELVAPEGVAAAAQFADATILSALAIGNDSVLCSGGSMALAAVAYCVEQPVWMIASEATRLPVGLYTAMVAGVNDRPDPWASGFDIVPHALVSSVFAPGISAGQAGALATMKACPNADELLRRSVV